MSRTLPRAKVGKWLEKERSLSHSPTHWEISCKQLHPSHSSMRLVFLHFHQGVLSTIGERLLRMLPSLPTPLHYLTTAVQRPIVSYLTTLYIYIFFPIVSFDSRKRGQVPGEQWESPFLSSPCDDSNIAPAGFNRAWKVRTRACPQLRQAGQGNRSNAKSRATQIVKLSTSMWLSLKRQELSVSCEYTWPFEWLTKAALKVFGTRRTHKDEKLTFEQC